MFVGNLDPQSEIHQLRKLFERFGRVSECDIIKNFGFVHMDVEEEAQAAIAALHGFEFGGTKMNVEMSHGKNRGGGRGGGGRGGGRGRGGGGGDYRGGRGGGGFRGRGRGRGADDRNGYSRGGGYGSDSYDRAPRYSPYDRPSYGGRGASEYSRPVTYPGLGPSRGYDDDGYGRDYARPSIYDRPSSYDRLDYGRPAYRERDERDPYSRPGPEYYGRGSGYSGRPPPSAYASRDGY